MAGHVTKQSPDTVPRASPTHDQEPNEHDDGPLNNSDATSKGKIGHTAILVQEALSNIDLPEPVDTAPRQPSDEGPDYLSSNAKAWDLYLGIAEREAREKATLWNTALDSLLLFAGLFAGVVSSFVIDAKADTQEDSEQQLLKSLLEMAESGSVTSQLNTPTAAYWISALWALSLCTTLFSAIMAVLAKSWLASYTMPSRCRNGEAALCRYRTDEQALIWHAEVAVIFPFLIQFAAFLFVLGFIIQLYHDTATLGLIVLGFAVFGFAVYLVITFVPLIAPQYPVSTPLSNILALPLRPFLKTTNPKEPVVAARDNEEVAYNILYHKLILSDKDTDVDGAIEAISEVALSPAFTGGRDGAPPPFSGRWGELAKTELPQVLLRRMKHYVATEMDDEGLRCHAICSQLLLFIAFAEFYELVIPTNADTRQYPALEHAFHQLLNVSLSLHGWDSLSPPCHALSFRLRLRLMALFPSTIKSALLPQEVPVDVCEIDQTTWERAHSGISSTHRIHVALASCRGLVDGQSAEVSDRSALTLSVCLGAAAFETSKTSKPSEWEDKLSMEEAAAINALASRYLSIVYRAIVGGSERTIAVGRGGSAGVSQSLANSLALQGRHQQMHTIKMLKILTPGFLLPPSVIDTVQNIASVTVRSGAEDTQKDGILVLERLLRVDESKVCVAAIVDEVRSALSEWSGKHFMATIHFVEEITGLGGPFAPVINYVAPSVVEVSLNKGRPEELRMIALDLSRKICSSGDGSQYLAVVKKAILNKLGKRLEEDGEALTVLRFLIRVFSAASFPPGSNQLFPIFPWEVPELFIQEVIPHLYQKLIDFAIYDHGGFPAVGNVSRNLLTLISNDDKRFSELPLHAEVWLGVATNRLSYWPAHRNAIQLVEMFSKRLSVTKSMLEMLLSLALGNEDKVVRERSLRTLSNVMYTEGKEIKREYVSMIQDIIVSASGYKTLDETILIADDAIVLWITLLMDLAKHVYFPESIIFLVLYAIAATAGSPARVDITRFLTSKEYVCDERLQGDLKKRLPSDLRIELPEVNIRQSRWIQVLAVLYRGGPLQKLAKDELSSVVDSMRKDLDGLVGIERSSEDKTDPKDLYLVESSLEAPLRRFLYEIGWEKRVQWVRVLSSLAAIFPESFPDAISIIFKMVVHDHSDSRHGILLCLTSWANADATLWPKLECDMVANIDTLAGDKASRIRSGLTQLLSVLARSENCRLPRKITTRLAEMAVNDSDDDIRSEAVNTLAVIVRYKERHQDAPSLALNTFSDKGMKDQRSKPRKSWVTLVSETLTDPDIALPWMDPLIDIAIGDQDEEVRKTALGVIRKQSQRHTDGEFQDTLSSSLGKKYADALQCVNPEKAKSAAQGLYELTLPAITDQEEAGYIGAGSGTAEPTHLDDVLAGHYTWVRMVDLLGRNRFPGVDTLIKAACNGGFAERYEQLVTLFEKAGLLHSVKVMLPRYIALALKPDTTTTVDLRLAAVTLFGALAAPVSGASTVRNASHHAELLGEANDEQIITYLADLAVRDKDDDLKRSSLGILRRLVVDRTRLSDLVKLSLSTLLGSCFTYPALKEYRSAAIIIFQKLGDPTESGVVSPSLPHLLRLALLITGKESEELQSRSQNFLLKNTAVLEGAKLSDDVLLAIPPLVPDIDTSNSKGKEIVLQIAKTFRLSDDKANQVVDQLVPLLKHASSSPRVIAIELLTLLYSTHGQSNPRLLESAIPEIMMLALDEKVTNEVRTTAIRLLVTLFTASETTDTGIPPDAKYVTGFMRQLHDEKLRPSIVELLSLMAIKSEARRTMSLQIISQAFESDIKALRGYTALLARLISDGRFADEPMDKVMLFFAYAMVRRPELKDYRFVVLSALWCRYRPQEGAELAWPDELVDWFTFALFGRHSREIEVRTWLHRCKAWLGEESEGDGAHAHQMEKSELIANAEAHDEASTSPVLKGDPPEASTSGPR